MPEAWRVRDDEVASAVVAAVPRRLGNVMNRVGELVRAALLETRRLELVEAIALACPFCGGRAQAGLKEPHYVSPSGWYHSSSEGGRDIACRSDGLRRRLRVLESPPRAEPVPVAPPPPTPFD